MNIENSEIQDPEHEKRIKSIGLDFAFLPYGREIDEVIGVDERQMSGDAFTATQLHGKLAHLRWYTDEPREVQAEKVQILLAEEGIYISRNRAFEVVDNEASRIKGD